MSELRLYTFVNGLYMRPVQHGIQSLHALGEMMVKYQIETPEKAALYDWAKNHKTVILLDGGNVADLQSKHIYLSREARALSFPAPFASFNEDEASLGGVMTCVSIVVPEEIYGAVSWNKAREIDQSNGAKFEYYNGVSHTPTEDFYFFRAKDNGFMELVATYEKYSNDWRFLTILKSCPLAR